MQRRQYPAHIGAMRYAGELFDLTPVLAAVVRDLDQPVVGPRVEAALLLGRFRERDDVAVERRRDVLGNRVRPPDLAHDRQLVAVELAAQIATDALPVVAAVVTAEEPIGREVDPRRRVRA